MNAQDIERLSKQQDELARSIEAAANAANAIEGEHGPVTLDKAVVLDLVTSAIIFFGIANPVDPAGKYDRAVAENNRLQ